MTYRMLHLRPHLDLFSNALSLTEYFLSESKSVQWDCAATAHFVAVVESEVESQGLTGTCNKAES